MRRADDSRFVVKDIRLEGLMRVSPANVYAQLPLSNGDTVDEAKKCQCDSCDCYLKVVILKMSWRNVMVMC
jgi:hypothetical protein